MSEEPVSEGGTVAESTITFRLLHESDPEVTCVFCGGTRLNADHPICDRLIAHGQPGRRYWSGAHSECITRNLDDRYGPVVEQSG